MANKAQEGLQDLLAMQSDAETAQGNLAKLNEARTQFVASGGDEADFAWPEAAATAVGIGWVLGPVGGLLIGAAAGFLGKEAKQAALDEYAADIDSVSRIGGVFDDQFERMAMNATSPEDLEQILSLQSRSDAAQQMMASASPELQAAGMQAWQSVGTEMTDYSVRQETQSIAKDVHEKQVARELDSSQQSIAQTLHDDYDAQSSNYEQTLMQSQSAREAIESGDPIALNAALIMVNKALDPTSVVRPEEAKALGNVGTLIDQGRTKLAEWMETGAPISGDQQKQLLRLVDTIDSTVIKFQGARDMKFQERAIDAGLPEKYVNDFRLVQSMPAFDPTVLREADKQVDIIDPVTGAVTDAMEAVAPVDGQPGFMDKIKDWYSGSGRERRAQEYQDYVNEYAPKDTN